MYAWEKPFQTVVKAARAYELKSLRKALFVRSIFMGFMLITERSVLFFTCLSIVLTGTMLTATLVSFYYSCTFNMLMFTNSIKIFKHFVMLL